MADCAESFFNVKTSCFLALLLRFCLIVYGEWQDRNMVVKYTDIDYHVFTDAARHVVEGNSPYLRPTYRYTPILSMMLTPNIYLSMFFGKILFVLFDVLAGYVTYKILIVRGWSEQNAVFGSWLWLFNPVPLTVSTRGNAESIMASLVLATIYSVLVKRVSMAAVFFALSVHFKIFPVIYGLPLVLLLGDQRPTDSSLSRKQTSKNDHADHLRSAVLFALDPQRVKFSIISALTFLGVTGLLYKR